MNDKFVIIEPNQSLHAEAVMDLAAKNFHGYWEFRDYCTSGYIADSHYDWQTSRIGMIGDTAVSHFGVWGFKMRIGTDAVRTGGIGAVCTDKPYRKKGYLAATAEASITAMRECGYDISLLFGIPNFYHKLGYVKAWDDSNYSLKSASLTSLPAQPIKLNKFSYTPKSWTDKIANSTNAGLTGTAVRPTYGKSRTKEKDTCWYWTNRKDEPSGYVMIRNEKPTLQLIDWGGAAKDILVAVSKLTNKFHSATINIRALHARSELFAELQTELSGNETAMLTGILRLHNVFGIPTDYSSDRSQVIPSLIVKAIRYPAEPFIVWGSGSQGRSFITVADVVNGLVLMMEKGLGNGAIQIGTDYCTPIKELAEMVVKISDKDIDIEYDLTKPEGDKGRCGDCTKANEILGWTPKVSLEKGLAEVYQWIHGQLNK